MFRLSHVMFNKNMYGLPPGSILQLLYFDERIKILMRKGYNSFIEVGSGKGIASNHLLQLGFKGIGFDLNKEACIINKLKNKSFIKGNRYNVINKDFLTYDINEKFDIIFSCMVIEHLKDEDLYDYFRKCIKILNPGGRIISIIPAGTKYWGIEDEIAGHKKRYEYKDIEKLCNHHKLIIKHLAGLNFPISNILLGLSNRIVQKTEISKYSLSQKQKSIESGCRKVKYKTNFPILFSLILNPFVIYPFHIIQKLFIRHTNCMVIYSELGLIKMKSKN